MLLEFLSHAISLDLGWIANLLFTNIHWIFAVFAFVVLADSKGGSGKKFVWKFIVTMGLLYAAVDIGSLAGWAFPTQMVFIPINFGITIFTENTRFQKHFIKIVVVVFFLLSFINTFYYSFPGA